MSLETPEDALGVEIGDIDGDGRSDVLVLIHGSVLVYRQAEGGMLAEPTAHGATLPNAWVGRDFELGAFDGDATPDLFIGTQNDVLWLAGGAEGELLAPRRLNEQPLNSGGSLFNRIRLADIDADGHLDATLMATNAVDLATYFGDGEGGLRDAAFVMNDGAPLHDFALADVTADGRPDAVGLTMLNDLVAFENLGDHFDHEPRPLARSIVDHFGHTVEAGDVDGDGRLDLLVSGGGNQPASLVVLHSTNAFTSVSALESYEVPETVLAADVNGDGLTDALVAHGGWQRLGLYEQCAGSLRPERLFEVPYASHYEHSALAIGDLDSNGCNDVAIADYNAGLTILYGSCALPRIR